MIFHAFHKIVCFTRFTNQAFGNAELLSRIKTAVISPINVIKEIKNPNEIKRTLKVNISPWGDLCLHEYVWDNKRILRSPFYVSRAERAWKLYDEMARNEIIVPEPVILMNLTYMMFTMKTYLASRWIEGGCTLQRLAVKRDVPFVVDLQNVLSLTVDALVKLHTSGFIHGDLKWSNVYFVKNPDPHVVLTDLDALQKTSSLRLQGKDFARFLIAPERYTMNKETTEFLIERYLRARSSCRLQLEKAVWKYLTRKLRWIPR